MGKAQSKRSVDITTETKKGPEGGEEVTGKLEKIEDIDQKQVNGDATPQEKTDTPGEKKDAPDETENDKDLTTEKSAAEGGDSTPSPTDGGGDQSNTNATETSPKEDASAAAASAKEGEEITPLADESLNKKTKKEKVKKKWSFRSISFGKKDKQKPAKAEGSETTAVAASTENAAAATNGEATETNKTTEEGAAVADASKPEDAAVANNDAETKSTEKVENGVASETEQQLNGQKTPTPTDDDAEKKQSNETSTVAADNETATATTNAAVDVSVNVTVPVSNETINEVLPGIKTVTEKVATTFSNGTADAEKNGDAHGNGHEQHEENTTAPSEDTNKSIAADEKPHQNGTNGDGVDDIIAATKTLQIEVKTEHQFDIVNSTTTNSTNNTTTTTIIPADNFNSEQKTSTTNNITTVTATTTSAHTDTPPPNTTNTSDLSFSSNNSIATIKEISHPSSKVLDPIEEISSVAVENEEKISTTELESKSKSVIENEKEIQIETENEKEKQNEVTDTLQQQQQPPPPPLPVSAPPSQVVIFALKDDENSNVDEVIASTIINDEEIITSELKSETEDDQKALPLPPPTIITTPASPCHQEHVEVTEVVEIVVTDNEIVSMTTETIDLISEATNNEEDSPIENKEQIIESIEILSEVVENIPTEIITQEPTKEEFEAEALNIVYQIQKELEKEEEKQIQSLETFSFETPTQNEETKKENNNQIETQIKEVTHTLKQLTAHSNTEQHDPINQQNENEKNAINDFEQTDMLPPPPPVDSEMHTNDIETENKQTYNGNKIYFKIQDAENGEQTTTTSQIVSNDAVTVDDCSIITDKQTIKKLTSDAVESNGDSKNLDEFVINSDKEMPTAKDLKENAAAAEITTQDLPVTCE